jgi:hypothetical protein
LFKAFLALLVIYVHVQFLRNIWQIWTNHLKYWSIFGLLSQTASICIFAFYLMEAIADRQGRPLKISKTQKPQA